MKKQFILLSTLLVILIALPACANQQQPQAMDNKVIVARPTWDTGWFQAAVYVELLTELGYEVETSAPLEEAEFYTAAAQGQVDLWGSGWFPEHHYSFLDKKQIADKVEPVGYIIKDGALQGYMVDKASSDKLGIRSLFDFEDPEIAAAFDIDGDGKADLIGCDADWLCGGIIDSTLEELEINNIVTQQQGSYNELMIDTVERYKRGEPVLFYTWTPNWTVAQLKPGEDVVWIEAPIEDIPVVLGAPGCVVTPCLMGFDVSDIRAVANVEFLGKHPDIRVLLEEVEIPLADIAEQNLLMFEGQNSDEDIARHAVEWIEKNRQEVDTWLEAAKSQSTETD